MLSVQRSWVAVLVLGVASGVAAIPGFAGNPGSKAGMAAWTITPNLAQNRFFPRVTALPDGRAFISGGGDDFKASTSCEFFDPTLGEDGGYTPAPPAPTPLAAHLAVLLKDGRILIAGGMGTGGTNPSFAPDDGPSGISNRSYIFDPIANIWTRTGDLPFATLWLVTREAGVLLPDGRVMAAGGARAIDSFRLEPDTSLPNGQQAFTFNQYPTTRKTYIFDPGLSDTVDGEVVKGRWIDTQLNAWSEDGLMAEAMRFVDFFPGGFGKVDPVAQLTTVRGAPIPAEVGSVVDGHRVFSAGTEGHSLVLLGNGEVLKIGGRTMFPAHNFPTANVEIFNPKTLRWRSVRPLPTGGAITEIDGDFNEGARTIAAAVRLADGRVLISGGSTNVTIRLEGRYITTPERARRTTLIYDPKRDTYLSTPEMSMVFPRAAHDLVPRPDGTIVAIGGYWLQDAETSALFIEPRVEVFDPATLRWSLLEGADMPAASISAAHYNLVNASGPQLVGLYFWELPAAAILKDGSYLVVGGVRYNDPAYYAGNSSMLFRD
jgi:Kelch motif protein